jgi:hypothetical protein
LDRRSTIQDQLDFVVQMPIQAAQYSSRVIHGLPVVGSIGCGFRDLPG